jgi:hypothetical protein
VLGKVWLRTGRVVMPQTTGAPDHPSQRKSHAQWGRQEGGEAGSSGQAGCCPVLRKHSPGWCRRRSQAAGGVEGSCWKVKPEWHKGGGAGRLGRWFLLGKQWAQLQAPGPLHYHRDTAGCLAPAGCRPPSPPQSHVTQGPAASFPPLIQGHSLGL